MSKMRFIAVASCLLLTASVLAAVPAAAASECPGGSASGPGPSLRPLIETKATACCPAGTYPYYSGVGAGPATVGVAGCR